MTKIGQTLLGLALVAAGIAGWFLLPERGELVVLLLVALGGFLISQGTMIAFGRAVVEAWKGIRKPAA